MPTLDEMSTEQLRSMAQARLGTLLGNAGAPVQAPAEPAAPPQVAAPTGEALPEPPTPPEPAALPLADARREAARRALAPS